VILGRLIGERRKSGDALEIPSEDEERLHINDVSAPGMPLCIRADQLRCLENVYELEFASDLAPYRWTGPGCSFALFLPIDRQHDTRFTLVCRSSLSPFNWENTFREIDGDMHLCSYHRADDRHHLAGTIPARAGLQGALVKFHLQETRQPPPDAHGQRDPRQLGLWLEAVKLSPAP
jgi:hypothetical protein